MANGMKLNVMGGGASDTDYVTLLREMLKNDWDVAERASAMSAIKTLKEQCHREDFDLMMKGISAMDGAVLRACLPAMPGILNCRNGSGWFMRRKIRLVKRALSPGITAA
jgi:hypothetical protein